MPVGSGESIRSMHNAQYGSRHARYSAQPALPIAATITSALPDVS